MPAHRTQDHSAHIYWASALPCCDDLDNNTSMRKPKSMLNQITMHCYPIWFCSAELLRFLQGIRAHKVAVAVRGFSASLFYNDGLACLQVQQGTAVSMTLALAICTTQGSRCERMA